MDKLATADFLRANGFTPPRSVRANGPEDLATVDWFPVVVKPVMASGGSRDCYIAQTPRQLDVVAEDKAYVLKKLAMSEQEFAAYMSEPPRPHEAYASEERYLTLLRALRSGTRRVRSRLVGLRGRRASSDLVW